MKLRLLAIASAILVLLAGGLCFFGIWIPNAPSFAKFPIRGVDISSHQGAIDWNSVAKSGITFAYLKATEGGDFKDTTFAANLQAANAAGIRCGAYHFFTLRASGAAQARNFISSVSKDKISLPPALDLEFEGNAAARPSTVAFRKELNAYINGIRGEYGREPVIYAADDFARTYLVNYSIEHPWVRAVAFVPMTDTLHPWLFWQFSEREKILGISGFVDADVFNGTPTDFEKEVSSSGLRHSKPERNVRTSDEGYSAP